jgi:hypothetical protein
MTVLATTSDPVVLRDDYINTVKRPDRELKRIDRRINGWKKYPSGYQEVTDAATYMQRGLLYMLLHQNNLEAHESEVIASWKDGYSEEMVFNYQINLIVIAIRQKRLNDARFLIETLTRLQSRENTFRLERCAQLEEDLHDKQVKLKRVQTVINRLKREDDRAKTIVYELESGIKSLEVELIGVEQDIALQNADKNVILTLSGLVLAAEHKYELAYHYFLNARKFWILAKANVKDLHSGWMSENNFRLLITSPRRLAKLKKAGLSKRVKERIEEDSKVLRKTLVPLVAGEKTRISRPEGYQHEVSIFPGKSEKRKQNRRGDPKASHRVVANLISIGTPIVVAERVGDVIDALAA